MMWPKVSTRILLVMAVVSGICATPALAQEKPVYFKSLSAADGRVLEARISTLSRQFNVREATLTAIAGAWNFQFKDQPLDKFLGFMESKAKETKALRENIDRLKSELSDKPDTRAALNAVYDLVDQGKLTDADAALVRLTTDKDGQTGETLEQWSDLVNFRGHLLTLAGKPYEARDIRLKAIAANTERARAANLKLAFNAAGNFTELGINKGTVEDLREAVEIYRNHVFPLAPMETAPDDWRSAQSDYGFALAALGRMEPGEAGHAALETAKRTYVDLLATLDPDIDETYIGIAQNNLGLVLYNLSRRQEGAEARQTMSEAQQAFANALETERLSQTPYFYMYAGNIVVIITEKELRFPGEVKVKELEYFIDLTTRMLKNLAKRKNNDPEMWRLFQRSLGGLHRSLGRRQVGDKALTSFVKAQSAYADSLEMTDRHKESVAWVLTQQDLAKLHRDWFVKTHDRRHVQTALASARLGLQAATEAGSTYQIEECRRLIGELEAL